MGSGLRRELFGHLIGVLVVGEPVVVGFGGGSTIYSRDNHPADVESLHDLLGPKLEVGTALGRIVLDLRHGAGECDGVLSKVKFVFVQSPIQIFKFEYTYRYALSHLQDHESTQQ